MSSNEKSGPSRLTTCTASAALVEAFATQGKGPAARQTSPALGGSHRGAKLGALLPEVGGPLPERRVRTAAETPLHMSECYKVPSHV